MTRVSVERIRRVTKLTSNAPCIFLLLIFLLIFFIFVVIIILRVAFIKPMRR